MHPAKRKGRDSNPRDGFPRLTVFKTVAFNRSATLPRPVQPDATCSRGPHGQPLDWRFDRWRGGRVAEGTRLLSEYGVKTPSRVRIPPSPLQLIAPRPHEFGGVPSSRSSGVSPPK